jgi:ATP-dependent Clp protease ATP-binding subunit ClpC
VLSQNYSPQVKIILALAQKEAEESKFFYIGVEQVFIALTEIENSLLQKILRKVHLEPEEVREAVRCDVGTSDGYRYWRETILTPRCEKLLRVAGEKVSTKPDALIQENDLLEAILEEGESIPVRVLLSYGIDLTEVMYLVKSNQVIGNT